MARATRFVSAVIQILFGIQQWQLGGLGVGLNGDKKNTPVHCEDNVVQDNAVSGDLLGYHIVVI